MMKTRVGYGPQQAARSRRHRHPLDPEGELLEELRKTMERMRALEKLKPGIDRVARSRRTPNIDETGPKRPPRRAPRARPFPGRKATALVVVTLFVATAVALVLYNSPTETPIQVNPPRWKDETATHFTFAAAGDFGGPESVDSIALMQRARTAGMSFVLALGDLGYTTDEAGWCHQLRRYVPELVIIAGNHDDGEGDGGNLSHYIANCPYPWSSGPVAGNGTPGYGYEYYFDYPVAKPLARFIMLSAGLEGAINYSYSEDSPHTEWFEGAVQDARQHGIPWVIVGAHRQCVTVGKKDRCSMGQTIFDEIVEAKVDLVLTGHDHVYERSNLLARSARCRSVNTTDNVDLSCVVGNGRHGRYPAGNGTVVVVQGVGGNEIDNVTIDGSDPEIGYIAEAMGGNANTRSGAPGFGSVFYTVDARSIRAVTNFCPPGEVGADGQCTVNPTTVFSDQFSIANSTNPPAPTDLSSSAMPEFGGAFVAPHMTEAAMLVVAVEIPVLLLSWLGARGSRGSRPR